MPKNNDLYFEVDSRLLVQLGENLVTNKSTALAELIKNSYDADATEVKIKMHNIAKPGGTLEISDNGQGMTLDRFKKTWMRIGTRDKELNPVSMKFKRVKAGDKGIGRFACRLLSDNLYLESISKNKNGTYEKIEIKFNWNDFTSGSDIDKIPISFNRVKLKQSSKTGTKIILNKLSDGWQKREVILMRNEIRILADPTNVFLNIDDPEDPLQFKIIMDIPEYPDTAVKIDENFYTNSWAQINGNIDEKGSANYRLLTKSKIVNELDEFFPISKPYMHLKNVELKFYVFAYRGDLFKNSNWSFKRTRDFLEENAGIKVYSDNFRVFGYGAKGDDWLSLTRDRARSYSPLSDEFMDLTTETRPGLRLFRNEVLVGFVKFSRKDNPKLQITANRNDLINNQAFQELKIYSRKAVEYAVALYSQELLKEDEIKIKEKEYIAKKRREEAITVEKKVKKEIKEALFKKRDHLKFSNSITLSKLYSKN